MYRSGTCQSSNKKISHKAKTTSEWTRRLRRFAAGVKFGRGERPPKGSHWDSVIARIMACPAHEGGDTCTCQYHPSVSSIRLLALHIANDKGIAIAVVII